MRTHLRSCAVLAAAISMSIACGGGDTGPRLGTPEYSWQSALEYQKLGQFDKAVEHLDNLAEGDSELKNRAILWRAAVLDGLARGHQELAEGFRLAMEEDDSLTARVQNPLQQAYRDARQYSIAFVESLGDLEEAISTPGVKMDFPYPEGSAAKPPPLNALERGEDVLDSMLADLPGQLVTRGVMLSTAELAGMGDDTDQAASAMSSGGVALDEDDTRLVVPKILLDRSVVFDKKHLYEPDIRKILVDRAEQWVQPYVKSENDDLKARAEQLMKEVEDERRELDGKRRRLKVRG